MFHFCKELRGERPKQQCGSIADDGIIRRRIEHSVNEVALSEVAVASVCFAVRPLDLDSHKGLAPAVRDFLADRDMIATEGIEHIAEHGSLGKKLIPVVSAHQEFKFHHLSWRAT
jgi:hypothetical protein